MKKRAPNCVCKNCGASFYTSPSQIRLRNGGQHCSRECWWVTSSKRRLETGTPNFKGDAATVASGRGRARRLIRDLGPCEQCGAQAVDRHHKNGNTLDNRPDNLAVLCRSCHMAIDGRGETLTSYSIGRRVLTDEQAREIWERVAPLGKPAPYGSIAAIAREYGVSDSVVRAIRDGKVYATAISRGPA